MKYTSTAFQLPPEMNNLVAMGNTIAIGGANTGEPFALVQYPAEYQQAAGKCVFIIPLDGAASVTVSISGEGEIVHKLEPKFLAVAYPVFVNIEVDANFQISGFDSNFVAVSAQISAGNDVILRITTPVMAGVVQYARLALATPTEISFVSVSIDSAKVSGRTFTLSNDNTWAQFYPEQTS